MRELTREPGLDGLDVGAIRRRMAGEVVGSHLYVFSEVVSTNAALRDLADAGAREGTVVIAESQRGGRGRFGTAWFSPPGVNLYVSVLLRPQIAASSAPIFSFIASLALTESMWELGVPASVKWPNDVVVHGRKVAGARLDLGIVGDDVSYAVIGVGINANVLRGDLQRALGDAAADATSLREALGRPVDRNALAAAFLNQLEKWLALYRDRGPDAVANAWRERDMLRGRRVAVTNFDSTFVGRVAGIDANGFLVVDEDGDGRRTVVSAAVRLLEEHRDG